VPVGAKGQLEIQTIKPAQQSPNTHTHT
jgi:hypothetical protein